MTSGGITVGQWIVPETDLEERFDTPGGPGGQHANRNRTAVTVRLDLGSSTLPEEVRDKLIDRLGPVVEATSSRSRSQWRNRALARRQLADRLSGALTDQPARTPTRPTRSSKERRLEEKKRRSQVKRDRRPPDPE